MTGEREQAGVSIIDVDSLVLNTLELEELFCFQCPLCSDPRFGYAPARECRTRARDLEELAAGPRSGVKAALAGGRVVGYAVFGPADRFPNAQGLPFEFEEDALVVGALYVVPDAREQNTDVDLLVAVMEFAREKGYDRVQVLCREDGENEPEARAEILRAAGFEITEPFEELCLASIDLPTWDEQGEAS